MEVKVADQQGVTYCPVGESRYFHSSKREEGRERETGRWTDE